MPGNFLGAPDEDFWATDADIKAVLGEIFQEPEGESKPASVVETKLCFHCGKGNHVFSTCKYRKYKCNKCKRTGHLANISRH